MDLLTAFVCKSMFEKNNLKQQEENLDGERERPCWSTGVRTCLVASIKTIMASILGGKHGDHPHGCGDVY